MVMLNLPFKKIILVIATNPYLFCILTNYFNDFKHKVKLSYSQFFVIFPSNTIRKINLMSQWHNVKYHNSWEVLLDVEFHYTHAKNAKITIDSYWVLDLSVCTRKLGTLKSVLRATLSHTGSACVGILTTFCDIFIHNTNYVGWPKEMPSMLYIVFLLFTGLPDTHPRSLFA